MLNTIFALAFFLISYPYPLQAMSIQSPSGARGVISESLGPPLNDPFYIPPPNISSYSLGQVVRSRPVSTLNTGASVRSHQLLYRTTNQQNKSTATVATVWAPARAAKPMKILSYQVAEDSVSLNCNPSWSWVNSSALEGTNTLQEGFIVTWALSQGWYVVSSDFEQNSAFLVGLVEARSVLDGVRAAAKHFHIGQNDTFEVGLLGYSKFTLSENAFDRIGPLTWWSDHLGGAAHATVWACSQAQDYAPELNIIGAAYGGTPVDPLAAFYLTNGGPLAVQGIAAFIGNAIAVPKVNDTLFPLLTPHGKTIWQLLQSPRFCTFANYTLVAGTNFTNLFTKDIFEIPYVQRTISEQSLLSNKSPLPIPVPKFPRLEWHGLNDTTVPVQPEVEYVKQQCARGADIRFGLFPGLNHNPNEIKLSSSSIASEALANFLPIASSGLPGALLFLQQAFDKTLVNGTCGTNTSFPAIGSTEAEQLLGEDINAALATFFIEAVKESSSM